MDDSRQIFIVSGISSGLGEAIFGQLLEMGKRAIGIGRRFTPMQQNAARQSRCKLITCDLANADSLRALPLEPALTEYAHDEVVFFSNAGVVEPIGRVGIADISAVASSLSINALAPIAIASLILRATPQPAKFIFVNISSGAASHAIAGWSAYCTGKAAARAWFQCLAAERPDIRVLDRDPGVMDTAMQATIRAQQPQEFPRHEEFLRLKTDNRLRAPLDVARGLLAEIGIT